MEENKKERSEDKVKIYDKDMYISQEKLKTIAIIIVIFVIGFVAGYFSGSYMNNTEEDRIANNSSHTNQK